MNALGPSERTAHMNDPHVVTSFHHALENIQSTVVKVGYLVEQALSANDRNALELQEGGV